MKLRIGTRRSRLALAQAGEVAERLAGLGIETELVPLSTAGDRGAPATASDAGVKGLFVAEIVHPEGVIVGAVPPRADPFDVVVTREPGALADGASIGTSSLRRRAQLARWRPALRIVELRGNVDTRLAKLEAGDVDALVLAAAGLARLGVSRPHAFTLATDVMVPAPGQGALALQARGDDAATRGVLERLDDPPSRLAFEAERAVMAALGGGCALPLGAYATAGVDGVRLIAVVATPGGTEVIRADARAADPTEAAGHVVQALRSAGAERILSSLR
ncbi:MAG: hydroxymethylbilane synthase [Deltaproteobacteria bacterium]|nr:MAG: hydroxymethylbilane synthase [Deltaproteobacteria bacterium]